MSVVQTFEQFAEKTGVRAKALLKSKSETALKNTAAGFPKLSSAEKLSTRRNRLMRTVGLTREHTT